MVIVEADMHPKKTMYARLCFVLTVLLIALPLSSCKKVPLGEAQRSFFCMDTLAHLRVFCESEDNANLYADDGMKLLHELEALLSRTMPGSDVSRINASKGTPVPVDSVTAELIREATILSGLTGGAFDITVAPLTDLWAIGKSGESPPTHAEIEALLPFVSSSAVIVAKGVEGDTVTLPMGMAIDLGGVAKGYALHALYERLLANSTASVVSLGGDVCLSGQKPDQTPFKVGLQDPDDLSGTLGTLSFSAVVSPVFIMTSGDYERFFEWGGRRYHHIFDPTTGAPAITDLRSVTIVTANGVVADVLSTALFVMGLEEACAYWQVSNLQFDMILVTVGQKIVVSEGLLEHFTLHAPYSLETLSRGS